MKQLHIVLGALFLLSACSGNRVTPTPPQVRTRTPFPPTRTATALLTDTPVAPALTATPSPIPTPTWVVAGPGDLTVPILLYHHIGSSPVDSRYYVPPERFDQELRVLHEWGYTTITIEMLIEAITKGQRLPPHPMLITFDDGHLDNYTNAFPIMQKHGFTGVLYIVGNYLGAEGFLDREQILEMYAAGWEIGCHSMNHYDLTHLGEEDLYTEIVESKRKLERVLGIDIATFAYPFGAKNETIYHAVRSAGYTAAMGAEGYTDDQGLWNLLNLQRVEIQGSEDARTFSRFLTWQGATDPQ